MIPKSKPKAVPAVQSRRVNLFTLSSRISEASKDRAFWKAFHIERRKMLGSAPMATAFPMALLGSSPR